MREDADQAAERLLHILDYGLFPCEYWTGYLPLGFLPSQSHTEFSPLITLQGLASLPPSLSCN